MGVRVIFAVFEEPSIITDAVPQAAAVPLPPVPVYAVTVIVQGAASVSSATAIVSPGANVSLAWLLDPWEKLIMYD
jgi:fructose-specific phosphotransferase system IIC component